LLNRAFKVSAVWFYMHSQSFAKALDRLASFVIGQIVYRTTFSYLRILLVSLLILQTRLDCAHVVSAYSGCKSSWSCSVCKVTLCDYVPARPYPQDEVIFPQTVVIFREIWRW